VPARRRNVPGTLAVVEATRRALRSIVGDHVLVDPQVVASCVTDWTRAFVGSTPAVVRPGSTDEVAELVRACRRDRVALVSESGNTAWSAVACP